MCAEAGFIGTQLLLDFHCCCLLLRLLVGSSGVVGLTRALGLHHTNGALLLLTPVLT